MKLLFGKGMILVAFVLMGIVINMEGLLQINGKRMNMIPMEI